MRTTVTLEEDVAREVREEMRKSGHTLKQIVNAALRRGFRIGDKPRGTPERFSIEPFSSPFQPGVDPGRLNQLADDLEVEHFADKSPRRRARV